MISRKISNSQIWQRLVYLKHRSRAFETLRNLREDGLYHYGNQSRGYHGGRPLWPPAVPRLAARPSQSNPRGSGPEVLKRERGHVTAETWCYGGGGIQGHPGWCDINRTPNVCAKTKFVICCIWFCNELQAIRATCPMKSADLFLKRYLTHWMGFVTKLLIVLYWQLTLWWQAAEVLYEWFH